MNFDAIVIGSGISGGWVAKELCARGLKTLLIERGRRVDHKVDYLDFATPWEVSNRDMVPEDEQAEHYAIQSTCPAFSAATRQWWVRDSEHPYVTPAERPFSWIRGYHLGGRSITWGRQTYRLSDYDFNANKLDGNGIDWPIRYADISPWYDRVESFAGISGASEGLEQLPDGQFLPPLSLNCLELAFKQKVEADHPTRRVTVGRCAHLTEPTPEHIALGRGPCQMRNVCERGCGYGAYFSSLSATLPAAQKTGNLTIVTDAIVERLDYDHAKRRVSGVRVIDAGRAAALHTRHESCSCAPRPSPARRSCSRRVPNIFQRGSPIARMWWAVTSWTTWWGSAQRARIPDSSIATTTAGAPRASIYRAT
jgi:choline dehydrogenase-like flavoprotein